jgi:hypothetical protein
MRVMTNSYGGGWGGGHGGDDFEVEMVATYDFEAYVDVDFDTDNSYENDVDIDDSICWDPYVDGNSVVFNVDAQAFGVDTLVDVSILALTAEDAYSSFTATGVVVTA